MPMCMRTLREWMWCRVLAPRRRQERFSEIWPMSISSRSWTRCAMRICSDRWLISVGESARWCSIWSASAFSVLKRFRSDFWLHSARTSICSGTRLWIWVIFTIIWWQTWRRRSEFLIFWIQRQISWMRQTLRNCQKYREEWNFPMSALHTIRERRRRQRCFPTWVL